jgi:hypothetical protein
VEGAKHSSRIIGCAESHLNILKRPGLCTPFIILEDDCQFTRNFRYRYKVPQEADALYLGVSTYGLQPLGARGLPVKNGVRFTRFGPNYLQVFNMQGSHAVIYLSETYRLEVKKKAAICCQIEEHLDVALASIHQRFLVLTPNDPVCYQGKRVGGNYRATRHSLLKLDQRSEPNSLVSEEGQKLT